MAFTVGWPEGNSAVSVEYADTYFADRGVAAWTGSGKQGALIRATDYVKALFANRFDPDLFSEVFPELPEAFMKAICEYALIAITSPNGLAPVPQVEASGYSVVTTKRKVGPLEKNFSVVGASSGPALRRAYPIADALIASLLLADVGYNRVHR